MSVILFDTTSGNLLLGYIPESLGLLIFGVALVVFALCLRRIFDRNDEHRAVEKFEQTAREANR
jgi:uncharacterized membrane protein YidH (DUF202 family)